MTNIRKFHRELDLLEKALKAAGHVLITAPEIGDGDSIGAQLALRRMILERFPNCKVWILNDQPLIERYRFIPDIEHTYTPETFSKLNPVPHFDVGIVVDGGVDRAGRVRDLFEKCVSKIFIDHHLVSGEYPYTIRIVDCTASSTTELLYHLSQTEVFQSTISKEFAQQIYLGLVFDTGFFRHSNTTPEAMELGAKLMRTGFDFTQVGEKGMLERSFWSLKLMSHTVSQAELRSNGKVIYSRLDQETLSKFHARGDDREGIIDQLFLTRGIEVAVLFMELPNKKTKISLRSHGNVDVAEFAHSLIFDGGGHKKAAGACLDLPIDEACKTVLNRLEKTLSGTGQRS